MAFTYNPIVAAPTSTTYTINAAAGGTYSNATWATTSASGQTDLKPNSLEVMGNANFQGDLKLQGKSLKESLDKIEERLAILHPNEELEEKWENLRGLRKMYLELEAEIIEKEKMWSILKK
jgi:hypothetical protein